MTMLNRVVDQLERVRLDRSHKERGGFDTARDEETIELLEEYEQLLRIKKAVTVPAEDLMTSIEEHVRNKYPELVERLQVRPDEPDLLAGCLSLKTFPKGGFVSGGVVPGQGEAVDAAVLRVPLPGETVISREKPMDGCLIACDDCGNTKCVLRKTQNNEEE